MTQTIKKKLNKAKWFIAGMGTVLSVTPMTTIAHPTTTSVERLANATNRVGAHFRTVMNKQGSREQAKSKAP